MAGSPVEQIKEKLEIAEFLKGYLELRPAGKNFKALCPFHREKSPSFMVSPDRGSWHCFGCNLGGDIFSFLMRYENIEFSEALKVLAEKAGIELQRLNPAEYKLFGLLYDLNDLAKNFFIKELANSPLAQKYLQDRGLKEETIAEFEIGFAPNNSEALNLHFLNAGHRPDDVLRAGLAVKSERGAQFDRFRGRVMFPIYNNLGKIVGFTGRLLPEFDNGQSGKYINSPETPIFNKSKVLYGFSKAKDFIRQTNSAFLVEGQMDLVMSWQSGIKNIVASSGTALTSDHLKTLRRLTDQLTISFDNDAAGWTAGERAIDLAENMDFNVKVVVFKDFKDAAEAAQAGANQLRESILAAIPAPQFYFEKYLPEASGHSYSREKLPNLRAILGKISNISSPIEQNFWLKALSERTGIAEKTLIEESEKLDPKKSPSSESVQTENPSPDFKRNFSRRELLSQHLLSSLCHQNNFSEISDFAVYLSPEYQTVLNILKTGGRSSANPEIDQLLNLTLLRSTALPAAEIAEVKKYLVYEYVKEKRQELTEKVKQAEAKQDEKAISALLSEINQLSSIAP
ncbi:MAG: DNA primase [Candidatus Liptonbacteria bacterium]|nr:DNA primase [Candidatus Liptonbacteria bacterium]